MFYLIVVNCTLMSRTKRETSVVGNVVLLMNKSCFLYLCFSFFQTTLGLTILQLYNTRKCPRFQVELSHQTLTL